VGERGGGARALGLELVEPLGGARDLGDEIVVQRLQDSAVQRLGVVPVGAQRRGKDLARPLVARDLELAPVFVEDLDVAHALSPTRSPSNPCGRNTSTRISTMNA